MKYNVITVNVVIVNVFHLLNIVKNIYKNKLSQSDHAEKVLAKRFVKNLFNLIEFVKFHL